MHTGTLNLCTLRHSGAPQQSLLRSTEAAVAEETPSDCNAVSVMERLGGGHTHTWARDEAVTFWKLSRSGEIPHPRFLLAEQAAARGISGAPFLKACPEEY